MAHHDGQVEECYLLSELSSLVEYLKLVFVELILIGGDYGRFLGCTDKSRSSSLIKHH